MQKVKIVTHSGCDLTFEDAAALNFTMIPDLVLFGEEQLRNNIDIHPAAFYARIEGGDIFPKSAHPSLADFMEAFRAAGACESIICLTMSAQMTGTINTARIAAQLLREEGFAPNIVVYDSRQVSFGLGFVVRGAARLARDGADEAEILRYLDDTIPRVGVYFIMRSLTYARRGGRIGAIRAKTADLLGVKPLLTFRDGTVSDMSMTRRFSDGVDAVFKKYCEHVGPDPELFIFHADNEADAISLRDRILAFHPAAKPELRVVGPAVGIYTGIGCVGISFREGERP